MTRANVCPEQVLDALIAAAKGADWQQVVQNGGPPCFHIEDDGRFCLRAQRWAGHDSMHQFTTLDAALEKARGPG